MNYFLNFLLCCILVLPSITLAESMTLAEVVHETLTHHPDIPLSKINTAFAKIEQQRIQGMLDPNITANASISDETTTTTSPFAANRTQFNQFSGAINKPLENGSSITASMAYNRSKLGYPGTTPSTFQTSPNPAYQNKIDLIYRYPLLRGHGNPAYRQQLNASMKDEESAQWQVAILKESLAGQAIALYYQLAADEISLKLTDDAIARAKKLLRYQKHREQFGLIETADRLQAEALLATRHLEKSNAEATLKQGQTSINRLMLYPGSNNISSITKDLSVPDRNQLKNMDIDQLTTIAERNRPQFKSLNAQLEAAGSRLLQATDQHDTQVDLIGQVGSRALDAKAGKAFGQGFTLNDRFISFGIEFSDTFHGRSTQAGIKSSELKRQQIQLKRSQISESLKSEISSILTRLISTRKTMKSAQKRAHAESKKYTAEMKRYREGRSDTATMVQFEGDLRMAKLQAALQSISLQMAWRQLELAQGIFFENLHTTSNGEKGLNQ
ncbi:MAG: TolC family protein [Mariprofundaceae bacterium]